MSGSITEQRRPGAEPSFRRFARAGGSVLRRSGPTIAALAPLGWPRPIERRALQAAMAEVRGARWSARRHRAWLDLVGGGPSHVAAAGSPVREARCAALARLADVEAEVDRAVEWLADPERRRRVRPTVAAAAVAASAVPVRLPGTLLSHVAGAVSRTAPPLPPVVHAAHIRPNLLTTLLADVVPGVLGNAPARHVLARLRHPVSIGVRVGRSAATVTLAADAIRLRNGIARRSGFILESGVEPLLRRAAGRLEEEAAGLGV